MTELIVMDEQLVRRFDQWTNERGCRVCLDNVNGVRQAGSRYHGADRRPESTSATTQWRPPDILVGA